MTTLILTYAPGDRMLINGTSIQFCTKGKLALTSHARFLLGKQIMHAEDAYTPLRKLYLALQEAYVGPDADHEHAVDAAVGLYCEIGLIGGDRLAQAMVLAHEGKFYPALKIVRDLIREEDGARACVSAGEAA